MLLNVHLWVGILVALAAVLAIWRRSDRRIALYAVTLQILIGIILVARGLQAPPLHYALALLGWAGYMAANVIERRGRRNVALAVAIVSSLLVLFAFAVGHDAVQHPS